jgi:cation diffusion facilitator family transporter
LGAGHRTVWLSPALKGMATTSSSKTVVYAALAGNLLVALTKLVAALWTGSSAMLSECFHSLVDTTNQGLMLYGMHRAATPPDEQHPLGHSRELYFWSFVVALLIFAIGAGAAVIEGILHILHPEPITRPVVNYIVLACSLVFEGSTWWIARREFDKSKGSLGYFEAMRRSKDPPTFLVLFEDSAAIVGLAIAAIGTAAAQMLQMPVLDGVASIAIGLLLAIVAAIIAHETKGLLIGESAAGAVDRSILKIASEQPGIERANGVITVHLGPRDVIATLSLEFADELTTPEIEAQVTELERKIKAAHPEVSSLFVKPQSAGGYRRARERRMSA